MEKMQDFFARRVDNYDDHMLNEVKGCREGYVKMAELIPYNANELLDLGCGTGLELEEIFKRFPNISVTGIDITREMLDKLNEKYKDKKITLINEDYFETNLGHSVFDTAVSFQTMHHFGHERKIELYRKIYDSLKNSGCYIECDYMVDTQEEEDYWSAENKRLRRELNISESEFYHYDIPCTVQNQIMMLSRAGFVNIEKSFQIDNTVILTARKENLCQ